MIGTAEPAVQLVKELCERTFGLGKGVRVARVAEGGSTYVFRVERRGEVFYVRVLPEQGASFAPEVLAHRLLSERGVHVPDVMYWEHSNPRLDRSVMVTTEIKGQAIGHGTTPETVRNVLVAAGHDLALTNAIPVQHFGWIRRDSAGSMCLQGEVACLRDWLLADLDVHLARLDRHSIFASGTSARIAAIIAASQGCFDDDHASLAHGDFDATHIYHDHGIYSGIIDWGEIRGTQPLYDLGHFGIENGAMLPYVLEGYREVAQLPADFALRTQLAGLLVSLGRLARALLIRPGQPAYGPYVAAVERAVVALRG
ncbi:MAG: phosphotransferase [Herpetosiphonaceae bacterium]|nr:phosphotransferase [Herpetosiphonaceae bacterium]